MSTLQQPRSGEGGGRNKTKKSGQNTGDSNANKKSDNKTEKEKNNAKPTAEQIRIAQIVDIKSESDDPKMKEKVANLMEMTQRSEDDVCCALYECDNDLNRAVIFLFETLPVGAFETSSKKKKNRLTSANNDTSGEGDGWGNESSNSNPNGQNHNQDARERSRSHGGMRGGRGGTDSRGWRGRENRDNDRSNSNFGNKDNWRTTGPGGGGGGGRDRDGGSRGGRGGRGGGFGGRGGRGGRMGPRTGTGSRDYNRDRNNPRQNDNPPEVDSWDSNQITTEINTWGDWDNEEYTGSLADTKVFTPSVSQSQNVSSDLSTSQNALEQQLLQSLQDDLVVSSTSTAAAAAVNNNSVQFSEIHTKPQQHDMRQSLEMSQLNTSSGSLSAEQSQYFNSLTQNNGGPQSVGVVNAFQSPPMQYASSYGSNSYGDQVGGAQVATRKPTKARVPPPSKIPATAVEMPGDALNNIQYLDVQFGGLDFGNEESFDTLSEKFSQTNIDPTQQNVGPADVPNDYQTKSSVQQSALVSGASVNAASGHPTSQIVENLSTTFSQRTNQNQQSTNVNSGLNVSNSSSSGLEQLSKPEHFNQANNSTTSSAYQNVSSYSASANNKPNIYQASQAPQGYASSNYSNTQASSNNVYPQAPNTYSTYNSASVNSYQQNNASNNNTAVNSTVATNANSSQNLPVNSSAVNSSSNSNSAYLSNQYPTVTQSSSGFPSHQSGYQNNQSVYGNTALNNTSGYSAGSTNTSASQYSNFSSSKSKDSTPAPVSAAFDSSSNVTSTVGTGANSAITTTSMSSPSLGLANTKVTNSTATKSGGGVVQNIPMVSQYIQAGMPFYQQPVYSFEDIQIMQQRMPHVPGYYDINYQTPTSLGAAGVRDANLGSVAYSTMSDGRFTRTDNNSSPVPSTMSQQPGSGGQQMLNLPYAYAFYGGMPGGFQYGTPTAIYPQQMATANATTSGQFPKPSYNAGYSSSGYDGLGQTPQDFNKGSYPNSGVGQQNKGQNVSNPQTAGTGSDINSSVYGKTHVALSKVNSYDKQTFHSGTPPPFNLTGTQTAGATSAQAYSAQHLYIPTMAAPHHNINMHQQMHQDSSSTGQRQQSSGQGKTNAKQGYSPSYWTAQN